MKVEEQKIEYYHHIAVLWHSWHKCYRTSEMWDVKIGLRVNVNFLKRGGILIGSWRMGRMWISKGWKPGTFQIEENGSTKENGIVLDSAWRQWERGSQAGSDGGSQVWGHQETLWAVPFVAGLQSTVAIPSFSCSNKMMWPQFSCEEACFASPFLANSCTFRCLTFLPSHFWISLHVFALKILMLFLLLLNFVGTTWLHV